MVWGYHYAQAFAEHVFIEPTGFYLWDKCFPNLDALYHWFKTKGYKEHQDLRDNFQTGMDMRQREVGKLHPTRTLRRSRVLAIAVYYRVRAF